jgi:hypothetical protein
LLLLYTPWVANGLKQFYAIMSSRHCSSNGNRTRTGITAHQIFRVMDDNPGLCHNHAHKVFRLQVYSLYAFTNVLKKDLGNIIISTLFNSDTPSHSSFQLSRVYVWFSSALLVIYFRRIHLSPS